MSAERLDFGGVLPAQEQHQLGVNLADKLWIDCFSGKTNCGAEHELADKTLSFRIDEPGKTLQSVDSFLTLCDLDERISHKASTSSDYGRKSEQADFIFSSNRILEGVIRNRENR